MADFRSLPPRNGDAFMQDVRADGGEAVFGPEFGSEPGGDPLQSGPDMFDADTSAATITTEAAFEEMRRADAALADALLDEWGEEAGPNLAQAREVAEKVALPELLDLLGSVELDGSLLGDHPAVVGTAARIGRMLALGADTEVEEGAEKRGTSGRGRDSLQKRIDSLHELQWQDPPKYASPRTQRELHDLYARLHGSEAIRDVEGRSRLR